MKFVIVSPRQRYGGAIVLHQLCLMLTQHGHDAKIFYTQVYAYKPHRHFEFWIHWIVYLIKDILRLVCAKILGNAAACFASLNGYSYFPVKGCKRKWTPFVSKDTVVIYPETVYGNFLHAEHVVRWLLYFNRFKNDPQAYGKNDLFICYRDVFNDNKLNPLGNKVTLCYFDFDLYKNTIPLKSRVGTCYIIRKGASRADLPKTFDGPIIDDMTESQKVQMFNKCRYCISYDTQTAYMKVAALCGCIPVVMPEEGKSRKDYTSSPDYGVAYGLSEEEIDFAVRTRDELLEWFKLVEIRNEENCNIFLKLVGDWYR